MEKLDLGYIKTRSELLRRRLEPILDVLVIANMKIEKYKNYKQNVPKNLIATRDKMYETALKIFKTEGPP